MTQKWTKALSLEQIWDYEARHPIVFAAPSALAEARLIEALGRSKRPSRRSKGPVSGASRRQLAAA
jgi:hypothetical protein